MQPARQPAAPGYIPPDTGINPHQQLFAQPRQNSRVQELDSTMTALVHGLFCLAAPVSWCCAIKRVQPMYDTIVTRCGVVTDVLREPGPYCINPCCTDTYDVYMGIEDMEIKHMTVNDSVGSPLVVSGQFVYRRSDSLSSAFRAESLTQFLKTQAESALRAVLSQYPYDSDNPHEECLKRTSVRISDRLREVLQEMVNMVGVKIESFSIFSISYDPRMEKLLLAPQEAKAELNARQVIAEAAAGIVEATIQRLKVLGLHLNEREHHRLATNLIMMFVNHGGPTTLNIFEGPEQLLPALLPPAPDRSRAPVSVLVSGGNKTQNNDA